MPDPAEERAAYLEALNRAYEAAAVAEGETPATPEAPELVEATPVVASDQTLVLPEETAETVVETPAVETAPETPEQLQEKIAQLEARLAEKDTFIGRQSGEVGELRQAIDALSQRFETQVVPAASPQYPITQEMIDNDPGGAAQAAFDQKNEPALKAAYETWKIEDPATAAVWLAEKRAEQREMALRQELAQVRSEQQAAAIPAQQAAEQKTWADAFTLVSKDHPEFTANAARLLEEVAPKYPHLVSTLATGDAAAKAEVLSALYVIDRSASPELQQELEAAAAAAAAEESATRNAAAGVVGQTTTGLPPAELTYEQQEQQRYAARLAGGVSLERGWTGRK